MDLTAFGCTIKQMTCSILESSSVLCLSAFTQKLGMCMVAYLLWPKHAYLISWLGSILYPVFYFPELSLWPLCQLPIVSDPLSCKAGLIHRSSQLFQDRAQLPSRVSMGCWKRPEHLLALCDHSR